MNYKMKKRYSLLSTALLVLSMAGCRAAGSATDSNITQNNNITAQINTTSDDTDSSLTVASSDLFSDRDFDDSFDAASATSITLMDLASTCSDSSVVISNDTITITAEGTYLLSGELSNGQICIDASNAKVHLILDGVSITNSSSAAIYVKNADKVFLTLAEGSENMVATTGSFEAIDDNNINACIYSKDDLSLNGNGSLTVTTTDGHGIVSKDDLIITNGTYHITASGHALSGKDSVCIADGNFILQAGKDGIHSENEDDAEAGSISIANGSFDITCDGDGMDASNSLQIDQGTYTIVAGGGSSDAQMKTEQFGGNFGKELGGAFNGDGGKNPNRDFGERNEMRPDKNFNQGAMPNKMEGMPNLSDQVDYTESDSSASTKGLKADQAIIIQNATISIDAYDDAIHAGTSITICNGFYTLQSGDDGIHADENLVIEDGEITIGYSYEGLEGQTITISGGNITVTACDDGLNAAGGADASGIDMGMENPFATSDQNWILIDGGMLTVTAAGDGLDSNGNLLISGGTIYVNGPSDNANAAIDYAGTASITGGTLIAVGSSGMLENFDANSSTQGCMLITFTENCSGDLVVTDSTGKEILSFAASKNYNSALISSPDIQVGSTYAITCAAQTQTVEMDSLIYGEAGHMSGFRYK